MKYMQLSGSGSNNICLIKNNRDVDVGKKKECDI